MPFSIPTNPYPAPPYFSSNTAMPPMQQTTPMSFTPPQFMNFQQPPVSMPFQNGMPPPFQMQPNGLSNPLGNSAPPINPASDGFSPRSQGYVPPMAQQPIQQNSQPARPNVQAAAFSGGTNHAPVFFPNMQSPQGQPQAMPINPQGMGFQASQPSAPLFQSMPQMNGMQQQPLYNVRTPVQPRERPPMDANKLWTVFLFGLLPLLFIPCLFVPNSLDFLRYAFMVLTVCGLGGMWVRQMFTPITRLIVSGVYVALCIVTIAMMLQGAQDAKHLGGRNDQPAYAQATQNPQSELGGMVPETQAPAEPTPGPMNLGPSAAEQRLTEFMTLWQGNNTPEMVSYVQPSWASAQDSPSSQLFIVLANRTPEDFTIEDISGTDDDSSRTVTMSATINKNNGKDPTVYRFMVLMVKEGGDWYVDPNSLATNDELPQNDENVVNNVNAGGLMTPAPRTTVTPVPPGSTILYYNADGGTFYHVDPECSSIKKEFLPLTGSFTYDELAEFNKEHHLKPCLKCGAPTKAIPSDAPAATDEPAQN
ncbi:MAG: hypothetical protein RSI32_02725 [Clostridia bacterium]